MTDGFGWRGGRGGLRIELPEEDWVRDTTRVI